jgi:7tm Chemosensory receptor
MLRSRFWVSALGATWWMVLLAAVLGVFPSGLDERTGRFRVTSWGLAASCANLAFAAFVNARSIHSQSVNILEKFTQHSTVNEIYPIATFMISFAVSVMVGVVNALIHRSRTCRILNDVVDTKNFVKALNGRYVSKIYKQTLCLLLSVLSPFVLLW